MTLRINSRAKTSEHPLDAYMTPPEAVHALMAVERIPKSVADPCVGTGAILDVLRAAGDHPPSRIWISSRRLPMMHRQNWQGPRASSNQAFSWLVWDKSNEKLKLGFFDWKQNERAFQDRAEPRALLD